MTEISHTERAYRALEEAIVTLRLEPGRLLSESDLIDDLGFGRTPIHDALHRLSQERLVDILPRKGIRIAPLDPERLVELFDIRRTLEQFLVRRAAINQTPREREAFLGVADALEKAADEEDDIAFLRHDVAFYKLMCQAARNEIASDTVDRFHGRWRRFWYSHYKKTSKLAPCALFHAERARLIAKGDPDLAVECSDRLLDYAESLARDCLKA